MLSSLSVGKVDAYPLVEPQDIANVTSNPFPFIGLFKLISAKRYFSHICQGKALHKINLRQMKNRLQQIEKSLGAERFFVLRQVILSFQPTDFMQIRTK